ncbi:MAG: type IV secretion system protein [Neisseriaceae bacterium]|nr:type IV secretion system protein [Neisseriaceae bacterium]
MKSPDLFASLGLLIQAMSNDLFSYAGRFIMMLSPIFMMIFAIYAIYIMIQYYNQGLDQVVIDLGKKLLFWLFVTAIAMNGDNYIYLANVIFHAPEEVAQWFTGNKVSVNAGYFDTAIRPVDNILEKMDIYYDSLKWNEFNQALKTNILSFIVGFLGYLFVGIGFVLYLVAKLSLAVILMVGPFYLGCLYFPAVRQWSMNWIGQVVSMIFLIVFYLLITLIFIKYLDNFCTLFLRENVEIMTLDLVETFVYQLGIVFLLFLVVMWKLPSIASSLTGGASLEGAISGAMRVVAMAKTGGMSSIRGAQTLSNIKPPYPNLNRFKNNSIKPGGK